MCLGHLAALFAAHSVHCMYGGMHRGVTCWVNAATCLFCAATNYVYRSADEKGTLDLLADAGSVSIQVKR